MGVVERFALGKEFLKWVVMMYTDIVCRIKVNGNLTEEVRQMRGLRQGCPLSVLLYVLYAEPFACAIRENLAIRGIGLPGGEVLKISQFADDTILYLADDGSVRESLRVIHEFSRAAGSKINVEKSTYKYLGKWTHRKEKICDFSLCGGAHEGVGDNVWEFRGRCTCKLEKKN